jgi:nitroreductase
MGIKTWNEWNEGDLVSFAQDLEAFYRQRRSIRRFSNAPVPPEVIDHCIGIAASAPSGANCQPWRFVRVSDAKLKQEIKQEAEKVEKQFYQKKVTTKWKEDLAKLDVNWEKPFLEEAPYLICIFLLRYHIDDEGNLLRHYYPRDSVAIATGFLLSALHHCGLASLVYTPVPMDFLRLILERPENEVPFLIVATGYPAKDYHPPRLDKKTSEDYLVKR